MKTSERTFYFGIIIALGIVIVILRGCQPKCKPCEEMKVAPVQVTAIDTVLKIVKDSTQWHKPKSTLEQKESPVLAWLDFSDTSLQRIEESSKKDSLEVLDWNLARFYSDTNHFDAGDVIVDAMVKKNRLGSLKVSADLKEKTIIKTITNSIPVKPRGQLYFGLVAQGDQNNLLTSFGVSSLFKTKRDKIWSGSVLYDRRFQTPVYQVGTYFKLSFRKSYP